MSHVVTPFLADYVNFHKFMLFALLSRAMSCSEVNELGPKSEFKSDAERSGVSFATRMETFADNSSHNHCEPEKRNDVEAVIAMRLALKFKEKGIYVKCQKLFKHAIILDGLNPNILSNYGEFLEEVFDDFIEADLLYTKALQISPGHPKALANHAKTSPIVTKIDTDQLNRIDAKVKSRISSHNCDLASMKTNKDIYLQHIYHTLALEGNTISLEEMHQILDNDSSVPGERDMEYKEVLGLDSALIYLHDVLLNNVGHITIEDILQLHKRVTGLVDPAEAGSLRSIQVFISRHIPPPACQIGSMMDDFVQSLKSNNTLTLNPIKQAALAHCKFVYIHPFLDGNGRTGRILMNLILMRSQYPPVIIRKHDQTLYYNYLDMADNGDVRPFVRFIARSVEDILTTHCTASKHAKSAMKDSESLSQSKSCGILNGSKRRKISGVHDQD